MIHLKDIAKLVVSADAKLYSYMHLFKELYFPTLLVVDENLLFLGTLTDGDVRRAFLRGVHTTDAVRSAMHTMALTGLLADGKKAWQACMYEKGIRHLPIVDDKNVLCGLHVVDSLLPTLTLPESAVIMCGGLGTRMGDLTAHCPKPMLPINGRPMLEHILENLIGHGLTKFYFAINYLGKMIEDHFGNGAEWGVSINYLREKQRLGTGGALSLLPPDVNEPFVITNGDVLTDFNLRNLLSFHCYHTSYATMGIAEFSFQNPYGVVQHQNGHLAGFEEKPVSTWFINAGYYVVSPELIRSVPKDTFVDMPTLLQNAQCAGKKILVYPICETWMDVGRQSDYAKAQSILQRREMSHDA